MSKPMLTFFSPAPWPADEADRQAKVDRIDYARAAEDPRLAEIVAEAVKLFGATSGALSIVDRDRQNWIVRVGTEETGTPRAISFCGHLVYQPAGVMTVRDAAKDSRFAGSPIVTQANVRFYAGAPVTSEGATLGALCVTDLSAHPLPDKAAQSRLGALAAEVSLILARYVKPPRDDADGQA